MSKPFELGKTYKTLEGKDVTIIEANNSIPGYETVRGDDHGPDREDEFKPGTFHKVGYRYNREGAKERGRCTGSPVDCPQNLIPEE